MTLPLQTLINDRKVQKNEHISVAELKAEIVEYKEILKQDIPADLREDLLIGIQAINELIDYVDKGGSN